MNNKTFRAQGDVGIVSGAELPKMKMSVLPKEMKTPKEAMERAYRLVDYGVEYKPILRT